MQANRLISTDNNYWSPRDQSLSVYCLRGNLFVSCLRLLTGNNDRLTYFLFVSMAVNSKDVKASRMRRSMETSIA